MVSWGEFAAAAPDIAEPGRARIQKAELVLVGTIRRDGTPRISPVEPDFVGEELMMGMMWNSLKARDLKRDPRCVINTTVADRHDLGGELKLICSAREVTASDQRKAYVDTIEARLGFRPEEPFHIFAFDIQRAWWIQYIEDGTEIKRRWPSE